MDMRKTKIETSDLASMNHEELEQLLSQIPKVDLHCHLDGSLRVETLKELARDRQIRQIAEEEDFILPDSSLSVDELHGLILPSKENMSLVEYLKAFDYTKSVLQTPESLERTAYELAVDCAKENVWYVEARFAPMQHINRFQDGFDVLAAVDRGLEQAEKEIGGNFRTAIVVCAMRNYHKSLSAFHERVSRYFTFSTEKELAQSIALETARLTVRSRRRGLDRVVGFDLAGAERNYPPSHYTEAFYEIINNMLHITVHAGEAFGPDSIKQAVTYLNAIRIGHGTRLLEEGKGALFEFLKDNRICVEVSLTSNLDTGAVKTIEEHPFREFLAEQLRVTLCTDNRLVSDTNMSHEFALATQAFGLTPAEIRRTSLYGFKSTFLPYEERRSLLIEARKKLDSLGFLSEDYH